MLPGRSPLGQLFGRLGWTLLLFAISCALLYIERDGLRDSRGTPVNLLGVLYFAVVTVTTIGYGDIVPVSDPARAMIAFGITPLRIAIWLIVLSTTYEFVFRRALETMQFSRLRRAMKDHTIICGFGVKGRSAADELLRRGVVADSIVVIDRDSEALAQASQRNIVAIRGDASSEQTLRQAGVSRAANIIVAPHSDESCVLICLTARDLAPKARIVAAAREDENVRLVERSGADSVIAPSTSGGRLLAAATESPWAAELINEIFVHGHGADLFDYAVTSEDVGRRALELESIAGSLILGVRTADETLPYSRAHSRTLAKGDIVIVYRPAK